MEAQPTLFIRAKMVFVGRFFFLFNLYILFNLNKNNFRLKETTVKPPLQMNQGCKSIFLLFEDNRLYWPRTKFVISCQIPVLDIAFKKVEIYLTKSSGCKKWCL